MKLNIFISIFILLSGVSAAASTTCYKSLPGGILSISIAPTVDNQVFHAYVSDSRISQVYEEYRCHYASLRNDGAMLSDYSCNKMGYSQYPQGIALYINESMGVANYHTSSEGYDLEGLFCKTQ